MQFSFVEGSNPTLNIYINLSLQAFCLFFSTSLLYSIFLVIIVIVINMLVELKVIAKLCEIVGDAEERLNEREPIVEKKGKSGVQRTVRPCDESLELLKSIYKYHSNILS